MNNGRALKNERKIAIQSEILIKTPLSNQKTSYTSVTDYVPHYDKNTESYQVNNSALGKVLGKPLGT